MANLNPNISIIMLIKLVQIYQLEDRHWQSGLKTFDPVYTIYKKFTSNRQFESKRMEKKYLKALIKRKQE